MDVGQGGVGVGVVECGVPAEGELVRGEIVVQLEQVVVVDAVGDAQVGIGKGGAAAGISAVFGKAVQDPVRIGDSGAGNEGGLFADGPFYVPPAGERTYAQGAPDAVFVTVLCLDAEDG